MLNDLNLKDYRNIYIVCGFTDMRGRYTWPRTSEGVRAMSPEQFRWLMHGFSIDPPIQVLNPEHCA